MDPRETLSELSPDRLIELLTHNPPLWVYAIVALIPLSVGFFLRELSCWFFKLNRIAGSLHRIELLLRERELGPAPAPEPIPVRRALHDFEPKQ